MDSIIQDIRVSLRALVRRPGFFLVSVLTLALGLGATTALFSVVYGVLLRPLPYRGADRIVSIWQTARNNPGPNPDGSVSHLNFLDWQRGAQSLESSALYSSASFVVTGLGDADVVAGGVVTRDFFRVFDASPVMGRSFTAAEDVAHGPNVVVVGYGFWRERLGGRPDAVGSTLEISGRRYEIVGVAPAGFAFPREARLWTPVQNDDGACGRNCVFLNGVARLRGGVSLATVREELRAIAGRLQEQFPAANANVTIAATRLQDEIVGDVRPALLMLFGAVFMVLLIACANVANLLLVRGASRQGEIAMRAALGAGRGRLLRLLAVESLVLALTGAAAGLFIAGWSVALLKQLAPPTVPRLGDVRFDAPTFLFALAIAAVTALIFGLWPAFQALRPSIVSVLDSRGETSPGRARWSRSTLLVAETALSFMLLVGAGLFLRSMMQLRAIDPGFEPRGLTIFTLSLPSARYPQPSDVVRAYDTLAERFAAAPGVDSVARINGLPLGPSENVFNIARPDQPPAAPGAAPIALYRVVDNAYFRTMRIQVVGRAFEPTDRSDTPAVVVVSRALAARLWPGENPIGRQLLVNANPGAAFSAKTIVGVAADVRSSSLAAAPQPELYVPHAQTGARAMTFVVRSAQPAGSVLAAARETLKSFDTRLPLIRPGTEAQLVARQISRPQFYLLLLVLFAGVALALAAVGVYGVVAYTVARRTREIGVRIALGADRSAVVRLVVWDGMRPAIVGIAIGTTGAFAGGRVLTSLLYDVRPNDPIIVAAVTATLAAVVALACLLPARRATRIPPATALRLD